MTKLGFTGRLAMWSARHRWRVIAGWLVVLVVVSAASAATGSVLTTEYEFTNQAEAQTAKRLVEDFRGAVPLYEQVVVRSDRYTVDDPEYSAFVNSLTWMLRSLSGSVVADQTFNYYEARSFDPEHAEGLVSADRRTTLIPTLLVGDVDTSMASVRAIEAVLHDLGGQDFELLTAGFASVNMAFNEAAENDLRSEVRALPIALVILLVVFGAVIAALVPMALAFLAIGITFGLVALVSNVWELSVFVMNIVLMIGLAVGIDYALLVVARFREQRRRGQDVMRAIGVAGDTASRAVVFSGATVVIALWGMFIVPTSIFRSFAVGASLVVIVSVLASLTLLPAALSLLGDRIDRLRLPWLGRRTSEEGAGFWAATARFVMRRAPLMAGGSALLLLVLAAPYASIKLGASGAASLPESFEVRRAFDILDSEFSAGRIIPTDIVVTAPDVNAPDVQSAIGRLVATLEGEPEYTVINNVVISPQADLAIVSVAVPGDASSDEAISAVQRLRTELVPAAFAPGVAQVYVGGWTAENADFFEVVDRYTPIVFAFVLGFSFLLLMLIFRSVVVPLKSILMNLLSVGGAYGVLVAIFQWGWLAGPLGFQTVPEIEAWLPLFMFTILFGLSMDYHIFLLSRIRERYDETHDNAESVAFGLRSTANIITGAAAIMVVVFGGFALGDLVMFQQIGVGLAVAVFLDATIVRTVLVPATMRLLGDANWYMPSWLRWLPDLRVEREPAPPSEVQALPVGSAGL